MLFRSVGAAIISNTVGAAEMLSLHGAEGSFLPLLITLHTQSCSPLRVNHGCQTVSYGTGLDDQVTGTADSSLVGFKQYARISFGIQVKQVAC